MQPWTHSWLALDSDVAKLEGNGKTMLQMTMKKRYGSHQL